MTVLSRIAHAVRKCKTHVNKRSPDYTASEIEHDPAAAARRKLEGLCYACSRLPWEDISEMSNRDSIEWDASASRATTCPTCRIFEASSSSDDEYLLLSSTLELRNLGFKVNESDSKVCCLLGNASIANVFFFPTILLSSLDHASLLKRLQQTYPESACLKTAGKWVADCETKHGVSCSLSDVPRLQDLSVIDCKAMRVVAAPQECRFIALSYVWGESTSPKIKKGGGLPPFHRLPRTIQQCIQVTCALDCRYLWVDRYCIRQDKSEDQRTQINQMGDIYAAAHLTIVAAAGQDLSYGLPGVSPTLRDSPKFEIVGNTRIYALPRINGLADAFYYSKWSTRAWTFQECFFSRRRLIFTDRQMIFVCNTSTCYEATTAPLLFDRPDDDWLTPCTPRNHQQSGIQIDYKPMTKAGRCLEEYSQRLLKFDDDAMKAISGALNTLTRESIYHIWGVPFHFRRLNTSKHISNGEIFLSWFRTTHRTRSPPQEQEHTFGRRRKGFPSWSQLAWDCQISMRTPVEVAGISIQAAEAIISLQELITVSTIIPAHCSQRLRLELETADLAIVRPTESPFYYEKHMEWMVALHYRDDTYVYFAAFWDVDPNTLPNKTTVKGVLLPYTEQSKSDVLHGSACVLLLQRRGSHYERIGAAKLELRIKAHDDYDPWHVMRFKYMYKDSICKFVNTPDIEQTNWWQRHFTKETIILG